MLLSAVQSKVMADSLIYCTKPSKHLPVQIQQYKHYQKVWNFKFNIKDTRTLFWCLFCKIRVYFTSFFSAFIVECFHFYNRRGQSGFHFLILDLKSSKQEQLFIFPGTKVQTSGTKKKIDSVPYFTVLGTLLKNSLCSEVIW